MEKETTILIIAQNGLKAAATYFSTQSVRQEKQAEKAEDQATKSNLKKKAAKAKKLAAILLAADQGITAYLHEKDTEE